MIRQKLTADDRAKRRKTLIVAYVLLVPALMIAGHLVPRSFPSVDPRISIERQQTNDSSGVRTTRPLGKVPDDGEVFNTADRLREASALALAATLYAAIEMAEHRSLNSVDSIIAGIQSRAIVPPGISPAAASAGALLSDRSKLEIRFRPTPLGIEVISFPRTRKDGPALMVRIPGLGNDRSSGSIFIADRLGDVSAPAPFVSIADCGRAGWIDQALNPNEIYRDQHQQLRTWLATRIQR